MRKTTILITILLIFTVGLVYIAVQTEKQSPPVIPGEDISQEEVEDLVPTINPQSSLAFSPAILDLTSLNQSTYSADILLNTNGQKVSGAQIELSYDPDILYNVSIFPSDDNILGDNPSVILNNVDPDLGRVSLEIVVPGLDSQEVAGSGKIATVRFSTYDTAASTTQMAFLPKTTVRSIQSTNSLLKSSSPLTITLGTAIASPTPTSQPL